MLAKFFLPALGLLFIGLKLTGYITWSWLWVTAPLWGGAAIVLLILGVALLIALLATIAGGKASLRRYK